MRWVIRTESTLTPQGYVLLEHLILFGKLELPTESGFLDDNPATAAAARKSRVIGSLKGRAPTDGHVAIADLRDTCSRLHGAIASSRFAR